MPKLFSCVALILGSSLMAACQVREEPAEDNLGDVGNLVAKVPSLPVAEPPLDRQGLIMAIARAASAAAVGADDKDAQRDLAGDRFEIRIRFGCQPAAAGAKAPRSWTFDEQKRVLRFRVLPDYSALPAQLEPLVGDGFEAVEGFWIDRPWILSANCPVVPAAEAAEEKDDRPKEATKPPAAGSEPSPGAWGVGIVQFYSATDARTTRRSGRAYEATKTLAETESPSANGYNLVLAGRLARLPNGRVIVCAPVAPDQPPTCTVSVQFDRVWIEEPASKALLAEWRSS